MSMRDDDERTTDVTAVVGPVVEPEATARTASVQARLVCVAGADLGRTFRIEKGSTILGRGIADVALHAKDVSRKHARLQVLGEGFVLEDLESANGTFVNGIEVEGKTTVRIGDRIQLGSTILVFAHHDELEDRMHQLQRLEAMAALAGGMAHDFNNALAVIVGTLDLMELRLPPQTELRDMVNEMKTAASSATSLARRLLRLGRTEPLDFEPVALAPLVQRTVAMMRRQLGARISIVVDVPIELVVLGSQEELHQVLMNLVINARDAMPDGGTLRIEACAVTFDRGQAATHHLPSKGEYVEVQVVDTGIGMDERTLARAFEPFFTTKPPGEGTGLGLAMIHSIVRRHGGAIVAESSPRAGTTFRIWLPRSVGT